MKGTTIWLSKECEKKYPYSNTLAKQKLIRFVLSCLVECGFSVVVELLRAKRNQIDNCKHVDLRQKLTKLEPQIK